MLVTVLSSLQTPSPTTASNSSSLTFRAATPPHPSYAAVSSHDKSGSHHPRTRMLGGIRDGTQPTIAQQGMAPLACITHSIAQEGLVEEGGGGEAQCRATVELRQAPVCQQRHMYCLTAPSVFSTWYVAYLQLCQQKGPHRACSLLAHLGWTVLGSSE